MNILHTESGLNWGGQEYRTINEVFWLNERGHRSWLGCDPRSESYKRGIQMGVPLIGIEMHGSIDPLATLQFARFCADNKVDLIHSHGPRDAWANFPLYVGKKPIIRSRQVPVPVRKGFSRTFIYKHGCWRILATSEEIRKNFVQNNGIDRAHIELIGEGVNFDVFHPSIDGAPFRKEFGIDEKAPLFGIIAMMRGEKGHHIFIDAALEVLKTHPQARFIMVGEGIGGRRVERECRKKIARAFGENNPSPPIIMTGYREDVPQIMAAMDVLAVPSLSEAQTLVVPQAFAMQRAVIASNVGGLPELVKDRVNGLLVPPADAPALAKAMKEMIDDLPLRSRLANAGYEMAKKELSFDSRMEETVALYRAAISDCKQKQSVITQLWNFGMNTCARLMRPIEVIGSFNPKVDQEPALQR